MHHFPRGGPLRDRRTDGLFNRQGSWRHKKRKGARMKTRFLIWSFLSLFAGTLALLSGCNSSEAVTPAGLWSCFATASGVGCVK
jgi:hypothetical protein